MGWGWVYVVSQCGFFTTPTHHTTTNTINFITTVNTTNTKQNPHFVNFKSPQPTNSANNHGSIYSACQGLSLKGRMRLFEGFTFCSGVSKEAVFKKAKKHCIDLNNHKSHLAKNHLKHGLCFLFHIFLFPYFVLFIVFLSIFFSVFLCLCFFVSIFFFFVSLSLSLLLVLFIFKMA